MIQDSVNRISYDGNGIATEFAYPFSITSTNDVKVMIVDADGTETILANDYTVDDVNSKVTYPGYPAGEKPPLEDQPPILAEGQRIVIYRDLDITQLTSLFNQYPFKAIEVMVDKTTILLQQLKDAQQRALTLSVSTGTNVSPALPTPSPLKSFRWNATGTALELTADPATVLASVQGYTELAEGYATTANEKAGIATTGANIATQQASLAQGYAESINVETFNAASADKLKTARKINGVDFDGSADITILTGFKNKLINGNFAINQEVVSGTVVLTAGQYGHDQWKAGASGCTYTFSTVNNVTTITITAGSLIQPIEGINLQSGTYVLSWTGTAQGKIGAGSYGASGVTGTVTGGTNLTVEFNTGTLSNVQLELGFIATKFEQRPFSLELMLCQVYWEKSYLLNVKPGTLNNADGCLINIPDYAQSYAVVGTVQYKVTKRTIPTVIFYSPATGATGKARNTNAEVDVACIASGSGISAVTCNVNGVAVAASSTLQVHWTSNARL